MANDKKFIAKNGIQGLDASVFTSITTSGKVGVGTASPVAGLDVLGTSGYTGTIHNQLYASGEGVRIFGKEATLDLLGEDNGDHASSVYIRNGTEGFAWINDPDSNSFQLRSFTSTGNDFNAHGAGLAITNLVSILDIGKTGNVGIGTDAPGEKLDVNGDARIRGTGSTMAGTTIANASLLVGSTTSGIGIDSNEIIAVGDGLYLGSLSGQPPAIFREGTTEYMRINNGGNVGINTNSPNTKLTVRSAGATGGNNTRVLELKSNGTAFNAAGLAGYNATTSYPVANGATLTYHARGGNAGNIMAHVAGVNSEPVLTDRIVRAASAQSTGTALYNRTYFGWDGTSTVNIASTQLLETISATGQTGSRYALYGNGDVYYAGTLTLGQADSASGHINAYENMTFNIDSDNDDTNRYFAWYSNGSSGSGTQRMTLDEGGNLGIGTATPRKQLHVLGGTGDANTTTVRFGAATNTDTNHTPKIELAETVDGSSNMHYGFSITGDGNSTNNLLFRSHNNSTGGTVALSIDRDSANVGIGTNDAGNDKLYVTGGRSRLEVQNVPNGVVSGNATVVVEATEAQLQILGVDTGSWASNITLSNAPVSGNNKHWTMHHTPASHPTISNALQFNYLATNTTGNIGGDGTGAASETKMTITNAGNVGVGSESPGSLLTVHNNATAGNTQLHIHNNKTGDAAVLRLEGGRTSSNDAAQINFANTGSIGSAIRMYSSGNDEGDMRFYVSGTGTGNTVSEKMRILSDGKVGINTTNPTNALEVVGANPKIKISANSTNWAALEIESEDTQSTYIFFRDYGGERARIQTTGANDLRILTGGGGVLGITQNSSGNVGIRTGDPLGTLHTHQDNTRFIMGAVNSNLAAQHRIEFWETPATSTATNANYSIEYDGSASYGGDGALLFRGSGSAQNQVFAGINRQGTTFLGMNGASPRVGIGTTNPVDKLDIRGNVSQIDGSPEYHFGTSSATHYNWRIAAQEAVDQGFEIASGTQVAGTSATSDTYTNRLVIKANGNVGIGTNSPSSLLNLYQAAASPVMMTLHNYQSDIDGDGFNQGSFIDFKMTDDNATFTPQARIGMVIGDSWEGFGDAGIPSEGTGNFQIYTGRGTDANGNGSLDLNTRFGKEGRVKIFTPGNTTDGTYYSTLTINNTGSSTWSRIRFDRSGVARWGIALGTDDKFRISNLYTNGSTASPNDNCFVIDDNSDVGIGTGAPAAKLHVYGTAHFQSDSGVKILSATNNPTNGAILYFSDNIPAQGQNGFIRYKHSDGSVIAGSNEQMIFGGDQPVSDFLFEGDVFSNGDITAYYSDPRLKDFHGTITGALDKVNSLSGYYFTENDKAKELGYRNERMQVGVNADEVAEVLPEVVTTALINEKIPEDETRDYKTVKYEKMVPLLIEAIKELTEQNMEMKQRLDKLEGEA